jgi:sugar/nucleoside kinase (ribokinase family)
MRVICIGSCSKDIFFPTGEGIIIETPEDLTSQKKIAFELGAKYQIEDRYESPGGVAANVSYGLAKLGVEVACYSNIGDDHLGGWILESLKKGGIGAELVNKEEGTKSDLSAIIVDTQSGDRTIFFNRDAGEKMEVVAEKLKEADWLFLSALVGNNWEKNMEAVTSFTETEKVNLAFNPGQRNIKDNAEKVIETIRRTKILLINKDEALEIVSSLEKEAPAEELNDEEYLLRGLQKIGPKIVVLTDGLRGSWVCDDKKILHSPTVESNPLETTGAGDAFSSGFLAAYLKSADIEQSLKWGAANSAHSVKFFGAVPGLLGAGEIKKEAEKVVVEKAFSISEE